MSKKLSDAQLKVLRLMASDNCRVECHPGVRKVLERNGYAYEFQHFHIGRITDSGREALAAYDAKGKQDVST